MYDDDPLADALLALTFAFRLFSQTFKVSKNATKFFLHFQSLQLGLIMYYQEFDQILIRFSTIRFY